MRIWLVCLILGVLNLTACSSGPVTLPDCQIPPAPLEATQPLTLPELPIHVSSTDSTATFDRDGLAQLKQYRISSETNKTIAADNAAALEARNGSVNALLECSRHQEDWMRIREEMLEQERRDHFIDNLWSRGLILVLAIVFYD